MLWLIIAAIILGGYGYLYHQYSVKKGKQLLEMVLESEDRSANSDNIQ